MRLILWATLLAVAGCTSSLDTISDIRETAPDWYEARKTELAGEGYPNLSAVPRDSTYRQTSDELVGSGVASERLLASFLKNPRAEPTYLTPMQISQWSETLRQDVAGLEKPANFLTDAEISALRAKFSRSRARN